MNYNVATYCIYLLLTLFIIIYVGRLFHRNGRLFILALLKGDVSTADHLNNILLLAYYLFNTGYAFVRLKSWKIIMASHLMVSSLAENLSILIFILAITHYLNMLLIAYFFHPKPSSLHPKTLSS